MTDQTIAKASSGIELRSIDYVPTSERHGEVSHLGAIWFVGNINLTAMATGVAALAIGASLFWTIVATVIGSLFGTFFMAFHSAQGPQLGLPQLVQSRPQSLNRPGQGARHGPGRGHPHGARVADPCI